MYRKQLRYKNRYYTSKSTAFKLKSQTTNKRIDSIVPPDCLTSFDRLHLLMSILKLIHGISIVP